jgi:hypothetical protein
MLPPRDAVAWLTDVDMGQICGWRRRVTSFKADVLRCYERLLETYFETLENAPRQI